MYIEQKPSVSRLLWQVTVRQRDFLCDLKDHLVTMQGNTSGLPTSFLGEAHVQARICRTFLGGEQFMRPEKRNALCKL